MHLIAHVQRAMIAYFAGDVRRINHFIKVYGFAKAIGKLEGLDAGTQQVLEIAALTHDIGIKNSERLYGSASGAHQQVEGPPEAEKLLFALNVDEAVIAQVCWLIAHHHTYQDIRGLDYRILVEADFLVNIDEDSLAWPAVQTIEREIFATDTGKKFLHALFDPDAVNAEQQTP
ncbi:MAG: HD domain-containing protein [Eubacteriales bacterium]|nr:HD domain-containing protein [Eubacteriales bacterium]